jgi:hypothetical protein
MVTEPVEVPRPLQYYIQLLYSIIFVNQPEYYMFSACKSKISVSAASILSSAFLIAMFSVSGINAQLVNTDSLVLAGEMVPAGARNAAIGNCGVAVPEGLVCAVLNPALFHSANVFNKTNITGTVMYGTGEPMFERYAFTTGAGAMLTDALSLGVLYRMFKPENREDSDNQVNLNISGRLFNGSITSGMVNMGLNVRYEKLDYTTGPFKTFTVIRPLDSLLADTTDSSVINAGNIERRLLALDVGFFQDNIGEGLDFGIVLHNALGYSWTEETPVLANGDSVVFDANTPDSADTVHWSRYQPEKAEFANWQKKYRRRLTVGIGFHKEVLKEKAVILLPFDLDVFNFLDFKTRQHFAIRTGIEVCVSHRYCLRFGYARAPEVFPVNLDELENENIVSGGAGVRLSRIGVDLYIKRKAWGISGMVMF